MILVTRKPYVLPTAISQFETALIAEAVDRRGRRLSSDEIATHALHLMELPAPAGRTRAILLRLAIKAVPDGPRVHRLLHEHRTVLRGWAASTMPQILETIAACNELGLPVPVIFSCEKYLATARQLQNSFHERYFNLETVLVAGDATALEETFDGNVLRLPVDDSYEGLPAKVFETMAWFDALGAQHGVLKLDDDLHVVGRRPLEVKSLRKVLAKGDYLGRGINMTRAQWDRAWHFGKTLSEVPAIYGKPYRGGCAAGALYYLSGRALRALGNHFLRFPGSLAGEFYEDKAVGDTLREVGIALGNVELQPVLGLAVDETERLLSPLPTAHLVAATSNASLLARLSRRMRRWGEG